MIIRDFKVAWTNTLITLILRLKKYSSFIGFLQEEEVGANYMVDAPLCMKEPTFGS